METLEPNLLALVICYLDNGNLKVLESVLPGIVTTAKNTNVYWHQKTELLLGKQLPLELHNWKEIYDILKLGSDDESWFSLAVTESNGSIEAIKLLIYLDKDPSIAGNNAIKIASEMGYIQIATFLLKDIRVNKSNNINHALIEAVKYNQINIVELLLKNSVADPIFNDNEPIEISVERGYTEIVKILLDDKRLIPDELNVDLIYIASREYYPNVIKLLLEDGRFNPSWN
jgi:ankyrin repeat protein